MRGSSRQVAAIIAQLVLCIPTGCSACRLGMSVMSAVLCCAVDCALQANLLATCGADATVQLFDLGNQRQLTTLTGTAMAIFWLCLQVDVCHGCAHKHCLPASPAPVLASQTSIVIDTQSLPCLPSVTNCVFGSGGICQVSTVYKQQPILWHMPRASLSPCVSRRSCPITLFRPQQAGNSSGVGSEQPAGHS